MDSLPDKEIFSDFSTFVFGKQKTAIYMEISGKIVQALPEQSGNGRNGVWKKKDYILETEGNYPKKVCVTVWGEKIDQFNMQEGDQVTVGIEIESREYNGRWYTDVKAWKLDKVGGGSSTGSSKPSSKPDVTTFSEESGDDVLPF
jgi:hypothetical protein